MKKEIIKMEREIVKKDIEMILAWGMEKRASEIDRLRKLRDAAGIISGTEMYSDMEHWICQIQNADNIIKSFA